MLTTNDSLWRASLPEEAHRVWVVRVFDKQTEALVRDVPASSDLPLARLRPVWRVPEDDPMYDSYPVREAEAEALRDFIDVEYRFDQFEYFLEQIDLTAD